MSSPLSRPTWSAAPALACLLAPAVAVGAVFTVSTTADQFDTPSGPVVSLREAVRDAGALSGSHTINFAPALSGQTLAAPATELAVKNGLTITAASLSIPPRVALSATRLFYVSTDFGNLSLENLILDGSTAGLDGSVVFVEFGSRASLSRCTCSGNTGGAEGGAISNAGTFTAAYSTFSGNSAGVGGAASNRGTMLLNRCTFNGNEARYYGGAVASSFGGSLTMTHCTLAGNRCTGADDESHGGGGLDCFGSSSAVITACLFAGNTAVSGNGPDVWMEISNFTASRCLVQVGKDSGLVNGTNGNLVGTTTAPLDPRVLPLASNGGPTQTVAIQENSPAKNAATVLSPPETTDQRGFPLVGLPDIGAYEFSPPVDCTSYLATALPQATAAQRAPGYDYDGDGATNEQEWNARTDPASAASVFRITSASRSGGNLTVTFPTVTARTYTLWRADALTGPWTDTGLPAVAGTGIARTFTVSTTSPARRFFRVQAAP